MGQPTPKARLRVCSSSPPFGRPTPSFPAQAWRAAMPRVVPFYAVKCHPEPGMLKLLMAMGTGFDCASKGELEMMLKMGVHPSRIIFAHPCKRAVDIRYAKEHGVEHTTFDTESELLKIAQVGGWACRASGCAHVLCVFVCCVIL